MVYNIWKYIKFIMKTVNILGYQTSSAGLAEDIDAAWKILTSPASHRYVACLNPHSLVEARKDGAFAQALSDADILLPDGAGIVLAAKLLGLDLRERVAGFDFFAGLSKKAETQEGLKYYFLGSTNHALEKIGIRLKKEYPKITLCGTCSPPFKEELDEPDTADIVHRVNEAKPDVLWVGMTAPKQEKWIHNNKDRLDVPLIAAVGAVFDFYAGTKRRAPEWLCRMGLEWLPRLLREPRRLFKRNFVSSPLFIFMVLQERFRQSLG